MSLITEYFTENPRAVNLSDPLAVKKYHAQLVTDRRAALLKGFTTNMRFNLDVVVPPPNPKPGARHPPALPSNVPIPFRLSEPLQSGLDENSQVWTAMTELPGASTTVVFKILQPSMCRYPEHPRASWALHVFPEHLAKAEAWAYGRLADKQGLLIPYFLGLRTITAPSGERAWVLVLEYIRGTPLRSYMESATPDTSVDTCNVFKLSMDTLSEFMADGWCNSDAVPRNIIVTGMPEDRRVVLIDLHQTVRFDPAAYSQFVQAKCRLYHGMCDALEGHTGGHAGEIEKVIENIRLELAAPEHGGTALLHHESPSPAPRCPQHRQYPHSRVAASGPNRQ